MWRCHSLLHLNILLNSSWSERNTTAESGAMYKHPYFEHGTIPNRNILKHIASCSRRPITVSQYINSMLHWMSFILRLNRSAISKVMLECERTVEWIGRPVWLQTELQAGQGVPCTFWSLSELLNKTGQVRIARLSRQKGFVSLAQGTERKCAGITVLFNNNAHLNSDSFHPFTFPAPTTPLTMTCIFMSEWNWIKNKVLKSNLNAKCV